MKNYSIPAYLTMFSCLLSLAVFYRSQITGNIRYSFLLWNLFLAWIPYIVSFLLQKKSLFVNLGILVLWLLFFPNAPYIITDLFHLKPKADIPFWFDTFLLFGYSSLGLLLGSFSMINIYSFLKTYFNKIILQFGMVSISLISAFGVYIGRYQRWNSWNIIDTPLTLIKDCVYILRLNTLEVSAFSLFFGGFIYASYIFLNQLYYKE